MNEIFSNDSSEDITNTVPTILMIEDSAADAKIIKQQIRSIWFKAKVIASASLSEAYELSKNERVDLVLLDLNLPDAYGSQTVSEVRRFCKTAPILVISGMDKEVQEKWTSKLGAVDYITKDFVMTPNFLSILKRTLASNI